MTSSGKPTSTKIPMRRRLRMGNPSWRLLQVLKRARYRAGRHLWARLNGNPIHTVGRGAKVRLRKDF